eukprot:6182869-Pleurochrysis_carterae.AAC.4
MVPICHYMCIGRAHIEMEVLAPLVRLALRRVPRREVSGRAVVHQDGAHPVAQVERALPRRPLRAPGLSKTHFLRNPCCKSFTCRRMSNSYIAACPE